MRILKQEIYFPIVIGIHFLFWAIDLNFYSGSFVEVSSDTMFFGTMSNESWRNIHRILGEVFSSWVVTVFAFNFLMATRAKWVEKIFGGLDKMYMVHRRSGVIAVVLLIAHFLIVPRDLTEFTPGKPLGFYAFILIILGVIISAAPPLKKKLPYHKWISIHKLMGAFYVMAVIHGVMVNSLIKELPITRIYVFGMAAVGIAAWVYRAFLYGIINKKHNYKIAAIRNLEGGITEIEMQPQANQRPLDYLAGQFAFFRFPSVNKREQHPFTISSHPDDERLRITVKSLGDYTNNLHQKLSVGEAAIIEGPFGYFSSSYAKEMDQVWIAGGIGITPFLSLAKDKYPNNVKLYWCVKQEEEAIYAKELTAIQENNPNFEIEIWISDKLGHLTADKLGIRDFSNIAFLLCGPQALKKSLTKQLLKKGVQRNRIYDEEFAFR